MEILDEDVLWISHPRVSFTCYVCPGVLVWCFQILINVKHAKWKHMVAIKDVPINIMPHYPFLGYVGKKVGF